MKSKLKVLDLFSGKRSVETSLINNGVDIDYKGIDIYGDKNLILDLSQNNIVKKLNELLGDWVPDIIWASPLCTPFSRATSIKNGTLSFEIKNDKLEIRKDFSYITHKGYIHLINDDSFKKKHQDLGKLGLKLFSNTKKIIKYFDKPFVIENPSSAVSKYILKEYIKNECSYCMYGFSYRKNTSIYTNQKLDLLRCNHNTHSQVMSGRKTTAYTLAPHSNKERSIIPEKLIYDIVKQLLEVKNDK